MLNGEKSLILGCSITYIWSTLNIFLTFDSIPPSPTLDFSPNSTVLPLANGEYVCMSLEPSVPGGAVYKPLTSDSRINRSEFISTARRAARLSLSLRLITFKKHIHYV